MAVDNLSFFFIGCLKHPHVSFPTLFLPFVFVA
jgi:hypothetical protein